MSLAHSGFLFDYRAFQAAAAPLVAELDVSNPEPLRKWVADIRHEVGNSRNWILHDKGTYLWDAVSADNVCFHNRLWGNWFLTILSTFLKPCMELGYDWTKLTHTLRSLGWIENDIKLVFSGLPTVWLLKPEAPYQRDQLEIPIMPESAPYWYLIEPDRSTYSGWLPIEEIERLQKQLLTDQHLLEGNLWSRIKLPPDVSTANAHISPDLNPNYWYERIPIIYKQTIEMMSRAIDMGLGLFSVVYQAYGDPEEWEQEIGDDQN